MAKLTKKQERFIDEYMVDLNVTQATIRAGYSDKTAGNIGHENLRKPEIQAELQRRMADRQQRTEITQDMVLRELAAIGFADIADYARVITNGPSAMVKLEATDDISPEKRRAIAGIKEGTNGVEVKLNDKVKALELLGRHLGMYIDKVDMSANVNITFEDDYGAGDDACEPQ